MQTFEQWLNEAENTIVSAKPKTATEKAVGKQISQVVANNTNTATAMRSGTPADQNKVIGNLTSQVVKHQQKMTPNVMGDKGAEIGDVIGGIDSQIKNVAKQAQTPKMMKKK